jgi:hypothetical protein
MKLFGVISVGFDLTDQEFWVPMKLVRLSQMCLNETYTKVCVGKQLSDNFPF